MTAVPLSIETLDRPENGSYASLLASLSDDRRKTVLAELTDAELRTLEHDWWFWARPKQLPPDGDWFIWLLLAGRGFGKTRAGAEWIHERARGGNEQREMALVSKTPGDARDDMIEGPGGLLNNKPAWCLEQETEDQEWPDYQPSNRRLIWPNGSKAVIRSGANPGELRGFSGDTAWCDELAAWKYPRETWDQLMFGMREAKVGEPRVCVTTTPKPIDLLKELMDRESTAVVRGSSYDNRENLSERYYETVIEPYEGTTLGQQEIYAEIIDENPDALWSSSLIERTRLQPPGDLPPRKTLHWLQREKGVSLRQVGVGVDPSGGGDEVGIVAAGVSQSVCPICEDASSPHGFVLADDSDSFRKARWGSQVFDTYTSWQADRVYGERNFGGDMVEATIRGTDGAKHVSYEDVTASRGKARRAQPVAALYEQGKVHHVGGFPELEDEMRSYVEGESDWSPNRMDALVWVLTKIMLSEHAPPPTADEIGVLQK